MTPYIKRLLDATDDGADLLNLGIFGGFTMFIVALVVFLSLYVMHAFWPARVVLDATGFAGAIGALAASYVSVLTATIGAMRWRTPKA